MIEKFDCPFVVFNSRILLCKLQRSAKMVMNQSASDLTTSSWVNSSDVMISTVSVNCRVEIENNTVSSGSGHGIRSF